MRKTLLILLALLSLPAMAEQRTASDAQNVAMNYLRTRAPRHMLGVPSQASQLTLAMTAENAADSKVDYYVFNNSGNRGFVIVSGDDKAAPVLGYCDEGSIDPENIPDGLRFMLDCYAEQMQYVRLHPESAYVPGSTESAVYITPLLQTNWNQDTPYNNLCPTYGPDNTRAMTGCVATATAQIMYYHKWPQQGTGENSYVCDVNNQGNQTLSANFGATTYEWDNMLKHYEGGYTEAQGNAVATLMYHVGVASFMRYGSSAGTPTYYAMEALRTNFKYNKGMKLHTRVNTPAEQWDSLLLVELQNARPVLFSGFTNTGGHCFVLDGYNTDGYYHVNWGWGGMSNGYFLLSALNPETQGIGSHNGGYSATQEFVSNLYPDKGEPYPEKYFELYSGRVFPNSVRVNLGEKYPINVKDLFINGYGYGLKTEVYLGLMLCDNSGNLVSFTDDNIFSYNLEMDLRYDLTYSSAIQYNTPTTLADGDYILWLMYKPAVDTDANYTYFTSTANQRRYLKVKVENGTIALSVPDVYSDGLNVVNLTAPEQVGTGNSFEVAATITNYSSEYFDNVYFALCQDGETRDVSSPTTVSVSTNGLVMLKSRLTAPDEAGVYELEVRDRNYNKLRGATRNVTVVANSNYDLSVSYGLNVYNEYMDMDSVGGIAVLKNSGTGDYVGPIPFMILSGDLQNVLLTGKTPIVTIPAGGSDTVRINTAFEGNPDVRYYMCLRNMKEPDSYTLWGAVAPFKLKAQYPTTLLENLLTVGNTGDEYRLANNLTIVDTHESSLFATDGYGSWIEVKCGDFFNQVKDIKAFKAGTVYGKYGKENGNPSITLTRLPEAGAIQPVTAVPQDLTQSLNMASNMVLDFSGYYYLSDGKYLFCATTASSGYGQSLPVSFDWITNVGTLTEGDYYDLHGVFRYIPATKATDDSESTSYAIYLTKAPVKHTSTAIGNVNNDAVKINVTAGAIAVDGAQRVAVYNMTGALVGSGNKVSVPAGIYVVIADGKCFKVQVK